MVNIASSKLKSAPLKNSEQTTSIRCQSSIIIRLYTCEADLEKAVSSLDTCRHDLKDREARMHILTTELRTLTAEKEHLQEIISHHQLSKERLCQEFDFRMFSLRVRIMCIVTSLCANHRTLWLL